jgi:iron-sulfur cluster assembly protein
MRRPTVQSAFIALNKRCLLVFVQVLAAQIVTLDYLCPTFLFRHILNKGNPMIKVSENAKSEVTKLLGMEGRGPDHFVRVGVKGGGCSGLMYDLDFDDQLKDGDKIFEDNGVKVVVDKKSLLYLLGTTLDFSGGLNGKGFQFVNPNANRTCGCGESFSI